VAYIRRLPSGKWNAVVRHPSGRRLSKTDALKKVVTVWAAEQEAAYRAGAASPCSGIRLPRLSKPAPRWLTRHEYDRLQMALATRTVRTKGRKWVTDEHADVWRALVGLACFSGLRPAELAGLDVGGLDVDNGLVHVRQVWTREHVIRPYLKTDRSNRFVPYPAEVGDLLWRVAADKPDSAPLFTSPEGGRVEFSGNFRDRVWVPTLEAAGIEPVRFYVCRHTCASWLVQAGVPDRKIMAVLGHADTHLIDVYAHLAPKAHDEVRAAWGEISRPTPDPRPTLEASVDD
jgi:integrase